MIEVITLRSIKRACIIVRKNDERISKKVIFHLLIVQGVDQSKDGRIGLRLLLGSWEWKVEYVTTCLRLVPGVDLVLLLILEYVNFKTSTTETCFHFLFHRHLWIKIFTLKFIIFVFYQTHDYKNELERVDSTVLDRWIMDQTIVPPQFRNAQYFFSWLWTSFYYSKSESSMYRHWKFHVMYRFYSISADINAIFFFNTST